MKIINQHPVFLYANDIQQLCAPLKSLGIKYFSHAIIDENHQFSAIASNPEFAEIYLAKKYYNYDIHHAKISSQVNYICWDAVEKDNKMAELYEDFNSLSLGHSFTIIRHEKTLKHYYHFSAALDNHNINQIYLKNFDILNQFILYFTEQINTTHKLKQAYDIKFGMEQVNANKISETPNISLPINRTYINSDTYLTPREIECLHWLSKGMTIVEISNKLSITPRTMKAHIISIKNKLNCKSLFQLGIRVSEYIK